MNLDAATSEFDDWLLREVSLTIFFFLLREVSLMNLVALLVGRWRHDGLEVSIFYLFSQGHQRSCPHPEDRTRDLWILSLITWPLDKRDYQCPEDVTSLCR
ncbi:hypothetical protein TNCV_3557501 [Trichonephila clavipes]|uniref:Uncharacterized protein n=1 Tax=Trichonephila clavipes TaxID=2585209 RepID=A0A8X6WC38_TRICX|nr:hypothetical protein TNCV_3557501 [Trichonephila clavipes]